MRTAAQKRYADKNKELLRSKDTRRNHHNTQKDAENNNYRNSVIGWRMLKFKEMSKKNLDFDFDELSFVDVQEIDNPLFVVEMKGKRCYENLHSPLPVW